jgi:arylsulfatase A-like enzyme
MDRRAFLAGAVAAAVRGQNAQPNFVVILTDDQRFDTIRALWGGEIQTPNMDRLVRRGVSFTHACTQGGLTGAICMPSRAQLMTGRSVFRVHKGIVDQQDSPDPALRTFPEFLRGHGYTTFATGKWHNGPKLFQRSFSNGSAIFFGGMSDHLSIPVFDYDSSARYLSDAGKPAGRFSSEVFTDAALGFLRSRPAARPYLLYVAYTSPHDPRMAPERFAKMYDPSRVQLPRNFMPRHPFDNGELKVRDELLASFPRTEGEIRKQIAAYYAMVSEVDAQIGRVLDAVEASPDAANTYIVFAGDNGLAVGCHGLLGKQNLYDHSLRVPLIISGPGVPKDARADTLCHLMDVCPTVLDLAGVACEGLDGRSLRPVLRDEKHRVRDQIVAAYRDVQRAVRTEDQKLILYSVNGTRTTQLFDLRRDPDEMNNLAAREPTRVRELASLLNIGLTAAGDDGWKWTTG